MDTLDPSSFDKAVQRISTALARVLDYVGGRLDSYRVHRQDRLHALWFTFTQGDTRKKTRLKVEFFLVGQYFRKITSQASLLATAPMVRREISAFNMFLDRLNVVVQVETPQGILADKVVAVLARSYVKGRDFWDIWFLRDVLGLSPSREDIQLRREIYGVTTWERSPVMGGEGWPSEKELMELLDRDLRRFLDHQERESLKREGYGRILRSVKSALAELL